MQPITRNQTDSSLVTAQPSEVLSLVSCFSQMKNYVPQNGFDIVVKDFTTILKV